MHHIMETCFVKVYTKAKLHTKMCSIRMLMNLYEDLFKKCNLET